MIVLHCLSLIYYRYSPWSAAALISITGIADAIGRIVFGWLGTFERPGKFFLFTMGTLLCGIACLLQGITTNYSFLVFLCILYGSSVGMYHLI